MRPWPSYDPGQGPADPKSLLWPSGNPAPDWPWPSPSYWFRHPGVNIIKFFYSNTVLQNKLGCWKILMQRTLTDGEGSIQLTYSLR